VSVGASRRDRLQQRSDCHGAADLVHVLESGLSDPIFAAEPLNAHLVLATVAILGAIVLIQRGERKGSADAPQKPPGGQSSDGPAVIAVRPPIVGQAIPRLAKKLPTTDEFEPPRRFYT